jgi:hypothetical protein
MRSAALALFCLYSTLAAADDLPRVDLHVHIDSDVDPSKSLKPSEAAALSEKLGVKFGVLGEGGCRGDIHDNATLARFIDSLAGLPVYRGLQVYGFDWPRCLSKENLNRLDYIAADALIFPDRSGKSIRLWLPGVRFDDPQQFMDDYVDYTVRILSQPIQVWANPTYLPDSLRSEYDTLWSQQRMRRVIDAAVKNHVAIEINSRFRIPSAAFVRLAKASGAKFTFGSNHHVEGIGDIEYSLQTARDCELKKSDIWLPPRR